MLSLYLHIPFCVRKCLYCDFLSFPADETQKEHYLQLLLREIECMGRQFADRTVGTVFFGGGTPSILTPEQIGRMMEALYGSFRILPDAEITMECNPGTADADKLQKMRRAGINRLSIGLQSTDDGELRRLGRIHSYEQFLVTYDAARAAGFENINIDLMSALPGQDESSWEQTLKRVIRLKPEHISAYSLILEEGTPFWEMADELQLPDEETDRCMYRRTDELLSESGYHRYEISNYAMTGFECRHNKVYWQRGEYLGLGLGAASLVGEVRRKCPDTMEEYEVYIKQLEQDPSAGWTDLCEEEVLTRKDRMEEYMFLGMRMTEGVSEAVFYECFGETMDFVFGPKLERYEREGLIRREQGMVRLTDRGLDLSNYVFSGLLLDD